MITGGEKIAGFTNKVIGISVGVTVLIVMLTGLIWPMIEEATGSGSTIPVTWKTMLTVIGLLVVVLGVVFIAKNLMSGRD